MDGNLTAPSFFDLGSFAHAALFPEGEPVWQALKGVGAYLAGVSAGALLPDDLCRGVPLAEPVVVAGGEVFPARGFEVERGDVCKGGLRISSAGREIEGASLLMAGAVFYGSDIRIGRGCLVEPGAMITGPALIGDRSEVRQGAYMRGNCLVGCGCVVGHATEVKNAVFLDGAKAGHFAYIGDSILGNRVNLGAGTRLANLRLIPGEVRIRTGREMIATGLRKMGAVLGDGVQTGCNTVTNPGTLMGPRSLTLPNVTVESGFHASGSILR